VWAGIGISRRRRPEGEQTLIAQDILGQKQNA
jgi:hypothetical protein